MTAEIEAAIAKIDEENRPTVELRAGLYRARAIAMEFVVGEPTLEQLLAVYDRLVVLADIRGDA